MKIAIWSSEKNNMRLRKKRYSRKPDEQYDIIEACSRSPYLELFGRGCERKNWTIWGDQADTYNISWKTYSNASIICS